jgi:hypothetical protein
MHGHLDMDMDMDILVSNSRGLRRLTKKDV